MEKRITIRLPEQDVWYLKTMAKHNKTTLSKVVRSFIHAGVRLYQTHTEDEDK